MRWILMYPVHTPIRQHVVRRLRKCLTPPFCEDVIVKHLPVPFRLVRQAVHHVHHDMLSKGDPSTSAKRQLGRRSGDPPGEIYCWLSPTRAVGKATSPSGI